MVILVKNAHFRAMRLLSPLMGKTTGILLLPVQLKTSPNKWWKKLDDVYTLRHNITMLDRWTDLKCPTKIALCMRAHADAR